MQIPVLELVELHIGSTQPSVAGIQECRIPCSSSPHFEPRLVAVEMTRLRMRQKWPAPAIVVSAAADAAFLSDAVRDWVD